MIRKPTVLILGAGASAPYGFPTGRQLLFEIADTLNNLSSDTVLQLRQLGFKDDMIKKFRNELLQSSQPSVDAFLEKKPEYMDLGKTVIACALIPRERPEILVRGRNQEWYEYLFNQLDSSREEFPNNELSIITFNYERSLQWFLFVSVQNSYSLNDKEAAELVRSIPIVHIYGDLGSLFNDSDYVRPFSPELNETTISRAVSRIAIVHEANVTEDAFSDAYDIIERAEIVSFLGFGYLEVNVERLRINQLFEGSLVLGSVFGLGVNEIDRVMAQFGGQISFGNSGQGILEFLRNMPVFS